MKIDIQAFIREFTVRICSSLNINVSLQRSWEYIKQFIDCDALTLHLPELDPVYIIAAAGGSGLFPEHLLPPFSVSIPQSHTNTWRQLENISLINDPRSHPVYLSLLEHLGIKTDCSCMIIKLEVDNRRIGSLWVWSKRPHHFFQNDADLMMSIREPLAQALSNILKYQEMLIHNHTLQEQLMGSDEDELIGWDSGMKGVMRQILAVANFDSPVLLYGETGVGKEVIAKMIHRHSSRSNGPFIKVNCGAIPETLVDSELFGHEKGAFTGAAAKKWGRFERADKGTIFLDEISEMPLMAQTRLLHVLQNKEIERVGGSQTIKLDIRVIAATNRDLLKMSDKNEFRKDLWFRLNIYPIDIPPLRDRKQDIPALIGYFIQQKCLELKIHPIPVLCQEDLDRLMSYDWPGNVREVKNIVERALISNQSGALKLSDFIRHPMHVKMVIPPYSHTESISTLDDAISETIRKALVISNGKISGTGGAADLLNTNPSTLRNKMKKFGISTGDLKKTMPRRFKRPQNNLDLDRLLSFNTH